MKKIVFILIIIFSLKNYAQTEYEIFIYEANVDAFDVFGSDDYEKNNRSSNDITLQLNAQISASDKAEPANGVSFDAKNLFDGNMKTCWMSSWDGKNDIIEFIIDLEENQNVNSAVLYEIYFANGCRKDLSTWKSYSRIKRASLSINEKPFAEITFENTYKMQSIDVEKFKLEKTKRYRFRLRILEVYKGEKNDQLAISDIQLTGKIK